MNNVLKKQIKIPIVAVTVGLIITATVFVLLQLFVAPVVTVPLWLFGANLSLLPVAFMLTAIVTAIIVLAAIRR